MGKDYGEPIHYDPSFNGPTHNRSCTDIVWLIVFIVFLGAWGYVGYYSVKHGDVEHLLAPIDSEGRRCGYDPGLENKKYLVFFDILKCLSATTPITGCSTPQVCVQQCPQTTSIFKSFMTEANFQEYKAHMICKDDIDVNTLTYAQAVSYMEQSRCAEYVLESQAVLKRCIGDLSAFQCSNSVEERTGRTRDGSSCMRNTKEQHQALLNRVTVLDTYVGWIAASAVTYFSGNERETQVLSSQIVSDLVQSRWYMAGALVGVVVLCFLYILLLRWVVCPLVWASIMGLLALLAFTTYLCYKNYAYYSTQPSTANASANIKSYIQYLLTKHETWMVLLILVAIALIVLLLIVIFLRARITIAIALIREGSKAVMAVKSTVFFPIFPWIFQCAVIAAGVVTFVFLLSIRDNNTNDKPHYVTYLHLVNLLGFYWAMFFISGISDMILASTFSTWYWTFHKRNLPFFTLTTGIFRTLWYHLGTVALGALIIAIVRVIRVILEYIDHKLKKFDNPFTRCILCCCKCFFWCLENFLKFINKNAYIMCAVHGGNFCKSARDAFSLLMRNIIRVVVLDKVTDFIFFLSKLLISIGVGFAVYYLLEWKFVYELTQGERLNYNYVPAVILSVATYFICTIFFNVYAMAVDTLFLCFLEDCERNDGSPEKPYFMSKNLMKILGKRNKQL